MLFPTWLKSMSSSSACRESWFGRKTSKHLVRPQVGGVVGNEVPGRVLACHGSWLTCSSTSQSQTLVGSSRDSFRSWSSRSLLSLTAGELLPPLGSPRLMVWFVALTDGKVLAWSEQDHEGWPPTLYMGFLISKYWSVASLICCYCGAGQNCLVYSCSSPISPFKVGILSLMLKTASHLERSHPFVPLARHLAPGGGSPRGAPLRRGALPPRTGSSDASETSHPWSSGLLLGLDEKGTRVATPVNEGVLNLEVMTATPNYLLK